jgi:hypothetical protein
MLQFGAMNKDVGNKTRRCSRSGSFSQLHELFSAWQHRWLPHPMDHLTPAPRLHPTSLAAE